jgi:hypothetical membrane protein
VIRWWPLVGLTGLTLLGLLVGKASTRIDDWFIRTGEAHSDLGRLLFFTDPRVMFALWTMVLGVALYRRRWRMVAAIVATPVVALIAERVCKRLFGRLNGGALAYPSGHMTLAVVVLGLAILVAGGAAWVIVSAVVVGVLGLLGQSFTYHYFTDTIGALFLGTALVCLAANLTGVNPDATHVTSVVNMGS